MAGQTSLFWFTNDLRIADNWPLFHAAKSCEKLVCVYFVEPAWFKPNRYGQRSIGAFRWQFLHETLSQLATSLSRYQQKLLICFEDPFTAIPRMIAQHRISEVHRSVNAAFDENCKWELLRKRYPETRFVETHSHTLFRPIDLPFDVNDLPPTYSRFRRYSEQLPVSPPRAAPDTLPASPLSRNDLESHRDALPAVPGVLVSPFRGGELTGQQQLQAYFSGELPTSYKEVRNRLDGWENSTKFSPWLANGSLSARQIAAAVSRYEENVAANESTYWIYFELLWREYFQWYARQHGVRLFRFRGINGANPLTSFYPERFQKWCQGQTHYPLVNACMHQLNATGYMSNRGRQIVASCLVNEYQLDWRYGAAYFEQQLIDYDPAVNWGNWQYLAGVGADPRGGRHFNLEKQTELHDPSQAFINRWGGEQTAEPLRDLDAVDGADWPVARVQQARAQ